jgi:hypothetical protein
MVDDQKRTVRVQLLLTPEEAQSIDDWRFAQRAQSKNEAIRRLITLGLAAANAAKTEPPDLTPKPPPETPADS